MTQAESELNELFEQIVGIFQEGQPLTASQLAMRQEAERLAKEMQPVHDAQVQAIASALCVPFHIVRCLGSSNAKHEAQPQPQQGALLDA